MFSFHKNFLIPDRKITKERGKKKTNIRGPTMCEALMKRIESDTAFRAQGLGLEVWQNLLRILRIIVKFGELLPGSMWAVRFQGISSFLMQRPILLSEWRELVNELVIIIQVLCYHCWCQYFIFTPVRNVNIFPIYLYNSAIFQDTSNMFGLQTW